MAIFKQKVNLMGYIPQYKKVDDPKKRKAREGDGVMQIKTDEIIGYHVFYSNEIKSWQDKTLHNTVSKDDIFNNQMGFLKDLKYLDELYVAVDIESLGSIPQFVKFEPLEKANK